MCPLFRGSTVHKEEDNLSIVDKMASPNVSFIQRVYCPDPSPLPVKDVRSLGIVVRLVFIHPHFSKTHVVLHQDIVHTTREGVRLSLPENVTNSRTRNDLQLTTTHPDLRGEGSGGGGDGGYGGGDGVVVVGMVMVVGMVLVVVVVVVMLVVVVVMVMVLVVVVVMVMVLVVVMVMVLVVVVVMVMVLVVVVVMVPVVGMVVMVVVGLTLKDISRFSPPHMSIPMS